MHNIVIYLRFCKYDQKVIEMPKEKLAKEEHFYGCPIEAALDVLGNKWKGAILYHLMSGTKRFNELNKLIPAVSQRVLTLQLRELENDEIVIRKVYQQVPPKVEYSLSTLGESLIPLLQALQAFGEKIMTKRG
jgi:DNA-binding HxlR family transcriptional regulator